jgi:hypothetical protein
MLLYLVTHIYLFVYILFLIDTQWLHIFASTAWCFDLCVHCVIIKSGHLHPSSQTLYYTQNPLFMQFWNTWYNGFYKRKYILTFKVDILNDFLFFYALLVSEASESAVLFASVHLPQHCSVLLQSPWCMIAIAYPITMLAETLGLYRVWARHINIRVGKRR